MKPFNLEEALAGKPVITGEGVSVRKVVFLDDCLDMPLVVFIGRKAFNCSLSGECITPEKKKFNIFMAVEKKTVWVNVYHVKGTLGLGRIKHLTQEEALARITNKKNYVQTIEISN